MKFKLGKIGICILTVTILIGIINYIDYKNKTNYEECNQEVADFTKKSQSKMDDTEQNQFKSIYLGFLWLNEYQQCIKSNKTNSEYCDQVTAHSKKQFNDYWDDHYDVYSEALKYVRDAIYKSEECKSQKGKDNYIFLFILTLILAYLGIINTGDSNNPSKNKVKKR